MSLADVVATLAERPLLYVAVAADDPLGHEVFADTRHFVAPEGQWEAELQALLRGASSSCLLNCFMDVPRARRREIEGALIPLVLEHVPRGSSLMLLLPQSLSEGEAGRWLRAELARNFDIEWHLHFKGAAGFHPSFQYSLVVARKGGEQRVTRLVNLRQVPASDWSGTVAKARQRQGGELGPILVLRNAAFDDSPWIFERHTRAHQELSRGVAALGHLSTLEEFVDRIWQGVDAHVGEIVDLENEEAAGGSPLVEGRHIGRDGSLGPPHRALVRAESASHLATGDLVLRRIVRLESETLFVAEVPPSLAGALPSSTVLALRWRADLPSATRALLLAYLRSDHAATLLRAQGAVGMSITARALAVIPAPRPSPDLVAALEDLDRSRAQYSAWAAEVDAARAGIFARAPSQTAVEELLERQRSESERVEAARSAGSIEFQLRNGFPHPFALRRERVRNGVLNSERVDEALQASESWIAFLAILGLQQQKLSAEPSRSLQNSTKSGELRLDWGKWKAVFDEAAAAARLSDTPLALSFPEFALLGNAVGPGTPFFESEGRLRDLRNRHAHNERGPDVHSDETVGWVSVCLDTLFRETRFVVRYPLLTVRDYSRDPATGRRVAVLAKMSGLSPVFPSFELVVESELSRGEVGVLDAHQRFFSLSPWLLHRECPTCKTAETFIVSRVSPHGSRFLSLTSGHAIDNVAVPFGL